MSAKTFNSSAEWVHPASHRLQEEPSESDGAAAEARSVHPGRHRGAPDAILIRFHQTSKSKVVKGCVSPSVWPDANPRGGLHGPREHRPRTDPSRSFTQHRQRGEGIIAALLHVENGRLSWWKATKLTVARRGRMSPPAGRDGPTHGGQGGPGRRGSIPAQERSQSGDQVQGVQSDNRMR